MLEEFSVEQHVGCCFLSLPRSCHMTRRYTLRFLWPIVLVSKLVAIVVPSLLLRSWLHPTEFLSLLSSDRVMDKQACAPLLAMKNNFCRAWDTSADVVLFPTITGAVGAAILGLTQFVAWGQTRMTGREEGLFFASIVLGLCTYVVLIVGKAYEMLDYGRLLCTSSVPSFASWFMTLFFFLLLCCDALALAYIYYNHDPVVAAAVDVETDVGRETSVRAPVLFVLSHSRLRKGALSA